MPKPVADAVLCNRIIQRIAHTPGQEHCDRYFACARLEIRAHALNVAVPSEMYAKWLNQRFGELLLSAARAETGDAQMSILWSVDPLADAAPSQGAAAQAPVPAAAPGEASVRREAARPRAIAGLHAQAEQRRSTPRYSLDDLIVGDSNRLAHAMAKRLAHPESEPPAKLLFIHGGCGIGKTHMLSGLAALYLKQAPAARVRYLTGEDFTNDYISAMRGGRVDEFRAALRRLDLLCIDDVHFLAGKDATQREFLHTFDALDLGGARVALASDASPQEIANFTPRLVSRCLSGMVVEIAPPDRLMRRLIARRFALSKGMLLDDSALDAIADGPATSARDLEGVIHRIQALAEVMPDAIDADRSVSHIAVRKALGDAAPAPRIRKPIKLSNIADIVCRTLGVELEDIRKRKRHRRVVLARSLIAYLAKELTTHSYPEIAEAIGCGSHSTMIEGQARIETLIKTDGSCDGDPQGTQVNTRELVEKLKRLIMNTNPPLSGL